VILGYGGVSMSDVYRIALKYFKEDGLELERQDSGEFKLVESKTNEEKRLEGRIIAARLAREAEEARMQALYGHLRAQVEEEEQEEEAEATKKVKPSKKKGKDTKKGGRQRKRRRRTKRRR